MRWLVWLLVLVVFVTAREVSGADTPDTRTVFDRIDSDNDGRIDRQEYQHWINEALFLLDTNKDGKLSLQELQKAHSSIDAAQFATTDRNRDGGLDMQEFRNALSHDFEAADKDKDGTLNPQEFQRL